MLLNNFYTSPLGIVRYKDSYKTYGDFSNLINFNSTDKTATYNVSGSFNQNWFARIKSVGVVVGTGTTSPQLQDWAMESPLTRNVDYLIDSFTANRIAGDDSSVTYNITIRNKKADESITITEIGLFGYAGDFSSMTPLFLRDVIEPRTISPGESCTFVVSFMISLEDN